MRLPAGQLNYVIEGLPRGLAFSVLGCMSFEDRCLSSPTFFAKNTRLIRAPTLIRIKDPDDAFPDHSAQSKERTDRNTALMHREGVIIEAVSAQLLDAEDDLIAYLAKWRAGDTGDVVVLDISSLPKRFFCFFLKRLLADRGIANLIVTYTEAGPGGYTNEPLCDDPMSVDHLPGFSAPVPPTGERLIVSVGFEALNMSSLVRVYHENTKEVRFLMCSPPSLEPGRRQWNTLREMTSIGTIEIPSIDDLAVAAIWDAEAVYSQLERWSDELIAREQMTTRLGSARTEARRGSLAFAPFGPKPHTLGMALFATRYRCGLFYTQPKSYNPNYSVGTGPTWAYVVKWDGKACFDR